MRVALLEASWSDELAAVEPHMMMHVAAVRRGELPGPPRWPDRSHARRVLDEVWRRHKDGRAVFELWKTAI